MAYYPKNKIKTNQVTAPGDQFYLKSTGLGYTGFYYKLSNGQAYTGKFPGDGVNELLVNNLPTQMSSPVTKTPSPTLPLYPTDQDYKNGMFVRYFFKKRNEYLFKELTKSEYDTLNKTSNVEYTLYKPFSIKWMLTGDEQTVKKYNYYSVKVVEEKENVNGLSEYLKNNYLKYYK